MGCSGEKTSKKFLAPNELKSPKNNMSFYFFSIKGGWMGGSDPKMDISIFFCVY